MQTAENYAQIRQLITKELNLPSPPAVAIKILNAVQNDEFSLLELSKIISADVALAAKVLKFANSGYFSCSSEIGDINRAISVLGTRLIKTISLSFVISAELSNGTQTGFNFEHFWKHSVTAAVAAELLAKALQHKDEDIFVTALLQNIGMLVISLTKGEEYNILLRESQLLETDLHVLEKDKFGFNHQQVGYALLTSWKLPESICVPIISHHPPFADNDFQKSTQIIYYADLLSDIYTGENGAEKARLLQKNLADNFDLDSIQVVELLDEVASKSYEVLESFELDPGEIKPYSLLLQEANSELEKLNLSSGQIILELKEAKAKAEKLAQELQDSNNRLKELVYRDGLTGLYNHRYFQEALSNELSRAVRYQSSVSLILFDIDHFKNVNDTHGHPAGDLVLMNIAKAVNNAVRPCDIVARYGGEEFAVILPETSAAGVKVFAARLRRCIEGIVTLVDGQLICVTVSAGATTFNKEDADVSKSTLIETADRGLYISKQNGRNQVTVLTPQAAH